MRFLLVVTLCWSGASAAQGWQRSQTSSGACEFWNTRNLTFFVDAAGNPENAGDTEFTAVRAALTAWGTAVMGCSDLTFSYGGTLNAARVEYLPQGQNHNVIIFRQRLCSSVVPPMDPCIAAGTCGNQYACWDYASGSVAVPTPTWDETSGELLDVDFELNVSAYVFTTVDAPPCPQGSPSQSCVSSDVQSLITQLTGRALGLDFIGDPNSTLSRMSPPGETAKRVIDAETVRGVCSIYPRGRPSTTCDGGLALPRDAGTVDAGTVDAGAVDGGQRDAGFGSTDAGSTSSSCSAATCAGCCSVEGRCELGTSETACGAAGLACRSCNGTEACTTGQCQPAPRGCGCTSFELSGALLLGLASLGVLRRRRAVTQR